MSLLENKYFWLVVIAFAVYQLYTNHQIEKMEALSEVDHLAPVSFSLPVVEDAEHPAKCGCRRQADFCQGRCQQIYRGDTPISQAYQTQCREQCVGCQRRCNSVPGHHHEALAHPVDQY